MPTPDQKSARLVILDKYPEHYAPWARCLTISDPLPPVEAVRLGMQIKERYTPSGINILAFVEDINVPATVQLLCDTCNARQQPHSIDHIKSLLSIG